MEKEMFSSISDVSKHLAVPAHTLRYWEKQFSTVIRPTTGAGGRRYYRAEVIQRLEVIKDLLYNQGMTIAGVKKLIHDGRLLNMTSDFVASENKPVAVSSHSDNKVEINTVIDLLNRARQLLN